jgi:hypothetical protein
MYGPVLRIRLRSEDSRQPQELQSMVSPGRLDAMFLLNFGLPRKCTERLLRIGNGLVMCKPGSAQMPRLRPGLRGLRPSQMLGRAVGHLGGWAQAQPGSGRGFWWTE